MTPSATDVPKGPREIADLPDVATFGGIGGRDAYRATFRTLFARPETPLVRTAGGELVVFRHAHLRALSVMPEAGNVTADAVAGGSYEAIRDPETAPPGGGAALRRLVANQVFFMNEPLHTPARRILTDQLSPKGVAELIPLADTVIAGLIADIGERDEIDFQNEFADVLAARFFGSLIGMTDAEQVEVADTVRRMSVHLRVERTPADVQVYDHAAADFTRLVGDVGRRSLAGGAHPVVTAMARDLARIDLADEPARAGVVPVDIGAFLAGNLMDAFHTAALGAADVAHVVLRTPATLDRLREDPSLLNAIVAEGLRIEPPVLFLNRYALEEIVFEGVRIPQGASIVMCWGAGNLDPEAFPDPETFSLDRAIRGATTFGGGPRICPGRLVAGMLAQRVVKALAESELDFELASDTPAWQARAVMAQLATMPVRTRRRRT